jgi:hypothetical protein
MKPEDLPEAIKSIPANERVAKVEKLQEQRTKLVEAIAELDRKRVAGLLRQMEANPNGVDAQVFLTFRKRATLVLKYTNE